MNRQKLYGKYLIREFLLGIIIIVLFILLGAENVSAEKYKPIDVTIESNWQSIVIEMVETISFVIAELEQIKLEESYIQVTDEEYEILCRIVEAETGNGCLIEQKMNVAWCVLNRVNDEEFPNDIESVVFQKLNGNFQFSPLYDNRYWEVFITDDTMKAVDEVLKNIGKHDGLFFMARSASGSNNVAWFDTALNKLYDDGAHEYFNKK